MEPSNQALNGSRRPIHGLSSSDSSFLDFDFLLSFFSCFFLFRSVRSSSVSPSCLLRFFESSSSFTRGDWGSEGSFAMSATWLCSSFAPADVLVGLVGLDDAAVPFSSGALKSLYSACHFAGVASFGLPYFCGSISQLGIEKPVRNTYIKLAIRFHFLLLQCHRPQAPPTGVKVTLHDATLDFGNDSVVFW